jgi:hypothetical protein
MWLVRDEVVQAHIKPRLDLLCDALTTDFYRPILEQVRPDEDPSLYVVKADVSGLVQRPNRLADASQLHAVKAIGDKALREAGGFEESDAPSSHEMALAVALQVGQNNPQLLDNMGEVYTHIRALLDNDPEKGPEAPSSVREPGTLKPRNPADAAAPPVKTAPNGAPTDTGQEARPLGEQDGTPRTGSPVG